MTATNDPISLLQKERFDKRYRRIRELVTSGVHVVGGPQSEGGHGTRTADTAFALTKSWLEGEDRDLVVSWEQEDERWDGDCPAPKYLLCGFVHERENRKKWYASLGMVGIDSYDDPYLEIEGYHLMHEAISWLKDDEDKAATIAAREMAQRATYAGTTEDEGVIAYLDVEH